MHGRTNDKHKNHGAERNDAQVGGKNYGKRNKMRTLFFVLNRKYKPIKLS